MKKNILCLSLAIVNFISLNTKQKPSPEEIHMAAKNYCDKLWQQKIQSGTVNKEEYAAFMAQCIKKCLDSAAQYHKQ